MRGTSMVNRVTEPPARFGVWLMKRPADGPRALLAGADSVDVRFISGKAALVGGSLFAALPATTRSVRLLLLDPQSPVAAAYDRSTSISSEPAWVAIRDTLRALGRGDHSWRAGKSP